jgi:protein regulator of cytokinesis 1
VKENVNSIVKTYMEKLAVIWEDCGYNDISIQQRCEAVKKHVQNLFDEMLEEEQGNKIMFIRKIEQYLQEMSELSKALSMEMPVSDYENVPLCDVERTLRRKMENFRNIKDLRLKRLAELKSKEDLLCNDLGIQPQADFANQIPTEKQLHDFEVYVKEKSDEKERLMQVYQKSKSAIIAIVNELKVVPTLEFEKLVICEEDTTFRPTKENMNALRQLHQRLEHQLEDTKAEVTELREKLTQLWDRLHEEYSHREIFLTAHRGHSAGTLKALKDEIKRCEELKRQNIKRFVEEIQQELKYWWDKCLVGEEERMQFRPHSSECFTEDLLELHELEVQKLQTYYEQNSVIFELAKQRQELWDKMLEMENRASDPNRLFQNRGGQLLLEEKERRNIGKELPKVERELTKHIKLYEEQHKTPFKIYGESAIEIINNQWALHRENKEHERKAKKFAKDRQLEVESRMGSQSRVLKRKNVPVTPVHSAHKLRKVTQCESPAASENNPCPKQQTVICKNILAEIQPHSDSSADPNLTTYTDFQDHLEVLNQEGTCRSSVVPGYCLRERNTLARTPSQTPSKILQPRVLKTSQPQETPIKPPRKYVAGQKPSSKQPGHIKRNAWGTPNSPMYQRGTATAPRLTTPRGKLPLII